MLSKLTLLCGEMVLPIGWTELQLKVPPMVGRYVDLKGMFEVSYVIWFLETSTPLHVYYSTYPNNVIQKIQAHITSQGQTIVHVDKYHQ